MDWRTVARFWKHVDFRGPRQRIGGRCWLWTGTRSGRYGGFKLKGQTRLAHRIAWWIANGSPPPANRKVCHRCDQELCVRPDHLWLGTQADNLADMKAKGRGRRSQFSDAQKRIIERRARAESQRSLARELGVSQPLISRIVKEVRQWTTQRQTASL